MLTSLALLILLGLGLGYMVNRLHLPSLIGVLIAGIALGPYGLDLLDDQLLSISMELRQIALIIILLRAGFALNIDELKQVGRPALLLCFLPACFEIGGIMLIAPPLLGVSLLEAAIIGAVVAAVSPAVIVPRMLNMMERKIGTKKGIPQMIVAAGSVDDVFVIILFSAFTTLALGGDVSTLSLASIPISIVTGLVVGAAMGYLLTLAFKWHHTRDSIKLLIILSLSFLLLALEKWLKPIIPMSGLLAVMAIGVTTLRLYPTLARRLSPKLNKLWVGAELLLFGLVGATVDINYAAEAGVATVALILLALIFRMVGVLLSVSRTHLSGKERLFCMIAYTPKATVQAAIGSLPLAMGIPCGDLVLTIAVLSIIITAPLGALGIDSTHKRLLEE